MQLVKKIMAGVLSLAVIAGACFVFAGCNTVRGNEYAYKTLTFTIITELEDETKAGTEDAVIKTTRTLSAREFYMYAKEGKTLEELAAATTEASDEEILEWCESQIIAMGGEAKDGLQTAKETKLNFKGNKVEMVEEGEADLNTGDKTKEVVTGKYTIKDGVIEVTVDTTMTIYPEGAGTYDISYFNVVGENVEKQFKVLTDAEDYAVEELYMVSIVFAEVK